MDKPVTLPQENWEEEFDNKFVFSDGFIAEQKPKRIKQFIRSLLSSQKSEIRSKVEGMHLIPSASDYPREPYNKAISDVLELLEG